MSAFWSGILVFWTGIPISWRIFYSLLWSTQSKALAKSIKQKYMFFWNSLAFSIIQQMLVIWSLVPLPFLNPAWTSGSSRFTYCGSLAWRILSITLLECEVKKWTEVVQSFPILYDPMDCSYQAPSSMEFSRQENWSGLPFPSPGDLPDAGIEPGCPTLQAETYHLCHQERPMSAIVR